MIIRTILSVLIIHSFFGVDFGDAAAPKWMEGHFANITGPDKGKSCLLFFAQNVTFYVQVVDSTKKNAFKRYSVELTNLTYDGKCDDSRSKSNITLYAGGIPSKDLSLDRLEVMLLFSKYGGDSTGSTAWFMNQTMSSLSANGTVNVNDENVPFTASANKFCTGTSVNAEAGYSFACGKPGIFWMNTVPDDTKYVPSMCHPTQLPNPTETAGIAGVGIGFNKIQIQPFGLRNDRFSDTSDCVPFFSMPILMGWFCGLIVLLLFGFGIGMIANINSMDRFENPRSKPLTITVKESQG